jgi:hypothetical protein
MNEVLQKAEKLISDAKNSEGFHEKYAGNLLSSGERTVDYCSYKIDLNKDYFIIIDFIDFGFNDFSIICKKHQIEIKGSLGYDE